MDIGCSLFWVPFTILKKDLFILKRSVFGPIWKWIVAMVILAYPLGRYRAKVYQGERTWSDFMAPIGKWMYKLCGINPQEEMNWKKFLVALLTINIFGFFWGMILLVCQGCLLPNPDENARQTPDLVFNTCISFMVNCKLQPYNGESGLTYFTQLFVIMLFQFITAATGMSALAGIFKVMATCSGKQIGNFWNLLVNLNVISEGRELRCRAADWDWLFLRILWKLTEDAYG